MFFILCCSFVSHIPVVKMIGSLRTFLKDLSQKDLWYKRTFNQKDLLARGPFPKDLLNQRTFGQKDLFSKGPLVKWTFGQLPNLIDVCPAKHVLSILVKPHST